MLRREAFRGEQEPDRLAVPPAQPGQGAGRVGVVEHLPEAGRDRRLQRQRLHLAAQVDELRAGGSRVETVLPDSNSRKAFGADMMDPSTRPPAARAGHDQGRALAEQLTATEGWAPPSLAGLPAVEIHLSDVDNREDFRKVSVIRDLCVGTVKGRARLGLAKLRRELAVAA